MILSASAELLVARVVKVGSSKMLKYFTLILTACTNCYAILRFKN